MANSRFSPRIAIASIIACGMGIAATAAIRDALRWNAALVLTPPVAQSGSSIVPTGYTLDDIYRRLTLGSGATAGNHSLTNSGAVTTSFHSLTQIYESIPTVDPATLLSGTTLLGVSGTIPFVTTGAPVTTFGASGAGLYYFFPPRGYYSGTTLVTMTNTQIATLDTNLTPAKILSGATIFGVTGTAAIISGTGVGSPATAAQIVSGTYAWGLSGSVIQGTYTPVVGAAGGTPKTGQTSAYGVIQTCADGQLGTCDDGYYEKGLPTSGAHYTDNSDGTVTDNTTALMWQKCTMGYTDTQCELLSGDAVLYDWNAAITGCEQLVQCANDQFSVGGDCSGSGGILRQDWRAPNVKELQTIVDFGTPYDTADLHPSTDSTFFPQTKTNQPYWTSTTNPNDSTKAYYLSFAGGTVATETLGDKSTSLFYIRCVR